MKYLQLVVNAGRPVLVALCLAPAALPGAAVADDGEGLTELRNFIDNVHTMTAHFEQSLIDADDSVVETSTGTLEISRPGRFRWTYSEPYEQILVADGLNVWNYDVDLAQVTVKAQAEVLGNTPALVLGGAGDVLDDFEYQGSFTDRGTEWVRLKPHESDSGFTVVELGFTDGSLSRMIFRDTLEQSTLIALTGVSVNVAVPEDRFHFDVPPDADLVGTPLSADQAGR